MGDMGDLFNDLKDIRRTKAQQRVAEFESKRQALEDAIKEVADERGYQVFFRVDQSGTWNITLDRATGTLRGRRSTIQFYPTKGTWQVAAKGKSTMVRHHGPDAFAAWIKTKMRTII